MYEYKIKNIIKVIDGDTVDALIDLGFNTYVKKRIRLNGINTPETRTRNKKEKELGLKAKERVKIILFSHTDLVLKSYGQGKFGRVLGDIYFSEDKLNLGKLLISEGHAKEYHGGKR